jgi:peptidoglycan/LPS O-acetylase OafA/YrhL
MMALLYRDTAVSRGSVGGFYIRRFFRLAPAFYVALALYILGREFYVSEATRVSAFFGHKDAIPGLGSDVPWSSVALNVFFLHGIWPEEAFRILAPAWSLSLEVQFYLVAPFFVWFLRHKPVVAIVLTFGVNAIGNALFGIHGKEGVITQYLFPSLLPNRIFLFGLGSACALTMLESTRQRWVHLAFWWTGMVVLLWWRSALVISALTVIVASGVLLKGSVGNAIRWICGSRPVAILAEWSYGIYLFHMFGIAIAGHLMFRWLPATATRTEAFFTFAGLSVVISLAIAIVVYYAVERPAREWGRTVALRFKRKKPVPAVPSSELVPVPVSHE